MKIILVATMRKKVFRMTVEEAISRLEIIINDNGLLNIEALFIEEYEEAIQQGISALEKQVAKKPIGISLTHEQRVGNCPCCNKLVGSLIDDDICAKCGQKLDWSDE